MEDIDKIEIVEPKTQFDAAQYEGNRVKILSVKQDVIQSHYVNNSEGVRTYNPDKTVEQPVIRVETDVVNPNDKENPITVNQIFSLQKKEDGSVYISKHPKAKLWKFMRKLGANKPSEMIGKFVTLTTEPSKDPNDDRVFLRIAI